MDHAATAAVLRNAHLTRRGEKQAPYSINLSSTRVRTALWILDSVRAGQPLGAVLGYQFERGLHTRGLDRYIESFRRLYPLVANKAENSTAQLGVPVEAIAARNVVDGLLLRTAGQEKKIPFGLHGLPLLGKARKAITAECHLLDIAVDSVADLLTSESVYQAVRGNVMGAAASLDALAQGIRPPVPEVANQPRAGSA